MLTDSRARTLVEIDEQIQALNRQPKAGTAPVPQWQIDRLVAEQEWLRSRAPGAADHAPAASGQLNACAEHSQLPAHL